MLLSACRESATIKEEALKLTTYPFSDPDPVVHRNSKIYPYFKFDKYTAEGEEKEWNAVVLENDYISVTVLPEIGGKIWSAVEKSSGESFLYHNHAAKFRNVAMRGPWTSGGIEANFGVIGHVPTTATPVDYITRTNKDGSVSCFIASFELITHTWWQVEINLPVDRACFTTRTVWHNTKSLTAPYYHWMNAAYKAADDLELYFPGQYYIGHEGDRHSWSMDEKGRDLSKYAQNNFGSYKSYHVLGHLSDFYAAWYRNSQFGSVHYSPYEDKLGMKIWIWGLSRQGMIWENLLSDTDGQYVELQSGRLYNQAADASNFTPFKQFSFAPNATDKWTEYWYPVKGIGGVVKAGECGALNVAKTSDSVVVSFCPIQNINDEIRVFADGKEIYKHRLSLGVLQTWQTALENVSQATLEVIIGDRKLVWSEKPEDNQLSRPTETPAAFNNNSFYGLYLQGEQAFYTNNFAKAEKFLKQSLAIEPFAIPALRNLASLYLKQGRLADADSCTRTILSINAYEPDGNLLYGLINSRLGRHADAIDGFSVAALSTSHRTAANLCLAKEYAKKQQWQQVVKYARQASITDSNNIEALLLKILACRKSGQHAGNKEIFACLEHDFPLNHTWRFEKYLSSPSEKGKKEFLSLIRNELPYETLMEIAGWYESMACYDEALKLYEFMPEYPVALYHSAYILSKRGEDGNKLLKQAGSLPTALVLPSRVESLPALEWATIHSDNWKSRYYLGILCGFLCDTARAAGLLEQCGNTPEEYAFYLSRAEYKRGESRLSDFLSAEKLGESWRAGLALIKYYEQAGDYEKMYGYAQKYAVKYQGYNTIELKYADAMLHLKKYAECTEYLSRLNILPDEGASEGHEIYRKAWLNLALISAKSGNYEAALSQIEKARLWPENLGVGKPYDEDIKNQADEAAVMRLLKK
ncbi:hypothetical protein FACS189452_04820 [Bacteroidia bacterium]|nr:hypothetical protein FACS189452_04820 [Bacteroidia bacterium]